MNIIKKQEMGKIPKRRRHHKLKTHLGNMNAKYTVDKNRSAVGCSFYQTCMFPEAVPDLYCYRNFLDLSALVMPHLSATHYCTTEPLPPLIHPHYTLLLNQIMRYANSFTWCSNSLPMSKHWELLYLNTRIILVNTKRASDLN